MATLGAIGGLVGGVGGLLGGISSMRNASDLAGIGEALGGIGSGVSQIGSAFPESSTRKGREAGRAQRAFMDEAYPGTNPWERLGTGQQGGVAGVSSEQRDMTRRSQRS